MRDYGLSSDPCPCDETSSTLGQPWEIDPMPANRIEKCLGWSQMAGQAWKKVSD